MKYFVLVAVGILTLSQEISLIRVSQTTAADASNVDECTDYKELSGPFRTFTYYNASLEMCDDHLQRGWYRFLRQAGRMMPTNCVPKFHCGTYGPGWLNGDHPMPQDGRVMRRICFHLEGECCKEWKMIQIRNCGNFMVYHLEPPPECPMRYCGDAVTEEAHILEEERPTVKEELTPTVEQKSPIVAEIPDECENHGLLDSADRSQGFYDPFVSLTDAGLSPGWYRFKDGAGFQMADQCVKLFHCGTHATGWLKNGHPTQSEGAVAREVCFHWRDDCCYFRQQIMVRRCEHFYIYKFPRMDISYLRYCGKGSVMDNHWLTH